MENWKYHNTYSGTPQGSIISPLLANIYLHELDAFIENYANTFQLGDKRRRPSEYQKYIGRLQYLRDQKYSKKKWNSFSQEQKDAAIAEMKVVRKKALSTPPSDPMDTTFRRIRYVRYADDFLIGVIGSKQDAQNVKIAIGAFLKDILHLELSTEKTLVTNAQDAAKFLSYDIFVCKEQTTKKDPRGHTRRALNGHIMLYVPKEKWMKKLLSYNALKITCDASTGYTEKWESLHRKNLLHLDDLEIVQRYNAEIRGIYNYYKIANNATVLNTFGYIMKYSMYRTFAAKYRSSVRKMKAKYRVGKDFGVRYETKSGTQIRLFYNEGFRRQKSVEIGSFDTMPREKFQNTSSALTKRLAAKQCEWCGAEEANIEIHHIHRLKDLQGKKAWERAMIGRKRKTMALCVLCHDKLHAGKLD